MSDRYAYLYGSANKFDLHVLIDEFAARGITLRNPANGRMTALTEEGDQIDSTLGVLERAVANHDPLNFQFWMPNHTDVFSSFRYLNDGRILEDYCLVGLNPSERNVVLDALVERFKSKAANDNNLFFVGDHEGYTIEHDWNELSRGGKYIDRICPDILCVLTKRVADFEICASKATTNTINKYILIDRR